MPGRNAKGQFVKGAPPGPGRPALADELPFIEGVKASCSAESVAQVMEKLHGQALKGNVKAAALYLAYAVGRPADPALLDMIQTLTERIAILEERLNYAPNGFKATAKATRAA